MLHVAPHTISISWGGCIIIIIGTHGQFRGNTWDTLLSLSLINELQSCRLQVNTVDVLLQDTWCPLHCWCPTGYYSTVWCPTGHYWCPLPCVAMRIQAMGCDRCGSFTTCAPVCPWQAGRQTSLHHTPYDTTLLWNLWQKVSLSQFTDSTVLLSSPGFGCIMNSCKLALFRAWHGHSHGFLPFPWKHGHSLPFPCMETWLIVTKLTVALSNIIVVN